MKIKDDFVTIVDWWRASILLRNKKSKPVFNEGEIWWASIGLNIGVEIFGKGDQFARPVIIFKKFNEDSFLGIPLTSKQKEGIWYFSVVHHLIERTAILSQVRVWDARRLLRKIGSLNDAQFLNV